MGISYYVCSECGDTYPDYSSDSVYCENCDTGWCSEECAEKAGYVREHCKKYLDLYDRDEMEDWREENCDFEDCTECEHYVSDSCKYCRGEDFEDDILFKKALELLNMTREDLVKIMKGEGKKE